MADYIYTGKHGNRTKTRCRRGACTSNATHKGAFGYEYLCDSCFAALEPEESDD